MRHFNCATAWGEREDRSMLLQLELFLKQQCQNKMQKSHIVDFPLNMYHLFQTRIHWLALCLSELWQWNGTGACFSGSKQVCCSFWSQSIPSWPSRLTWKYIQIMDFWQFDLGVFSYGLTWPVQGPAHCQPLWSAQGPFRLPESSVTWFRLVTCIFLCAHSANMLCF